MKLIVLVWLVIDCFCVRLVIVLYELYTLCFWSYLHCDCVPTIEVPSWVLRIYWGVMIWPEIPIIWYLVGSMANAIRHKLIVTLDFVLDTDAQSDIGGDIGHFEGYLLDFMSRKSRLTQCKIIIISIARYFHFGFVHKSQSWVHQPGGKIEFFWGCFCLEHIQ